MACAVGSRAFDIINAPETLAHVEQQGQKLQTALREIGEKTGVFKEVRGMGLLLGCVLADEYEGKASKITAAHFETRPDGTGCRRQCGALAPSLLLNDEDMAEG